MKQYRLIFVAVVAVFLITGYAEYSMGRLPWGPDGTFGLYSADVWSSEQSQRVMDPYSPSHFIHGMLFYGLLWLMARRVPMKWRFVMALALEAAWEILENSPIIINRYRAVTISLGYEGDSILNSLSDIVFAGLGFWFAFRQRLRVSIATIIALELITLWWVRDNLTINIIMLIHPLEAIKQWQLQVAPPL
jgi:hypothetical protein